MVNNGFHGASTAAIEHHYDLSNDFYGVWLDQTRTYSCAFWENGDDLHAAQLRKLDFAVAAARATVATRVLDVGCGWGGLLRRLVEIYDVKHAVGLTMSPAQAEWASRHLPADAEIRLENWYDHDEDQKYDSIISIGAFEHFARYALPRQARVRGYRDFFARCHGWLPGNRRLFVQTIVKGSNVRLNRQTIDDLQFVIDNIFPESELPWPSELIEASEKLFDVVSVRNDAEHYARTCEAWLERLRNSRDEAVNFVGEQRVRDFERYLDVCARQFRQNHLGLLRVTFERR